MQIESGFLPSGQLDIKDSQEADKPVLPALGGDRGGRKFLPRMIFYLPQIAQMNTDLSFRH